MNIIKFSHKYYKLPSHFPFSAKLLHVFISNTSMIKKDFHDYDTKYFDYTEDKESFYELPTGSVIILLLLTPDNKLFTTIRRYEKQKYQYYMSNVGTMFECVRTT